MDDKNITCPVCGMEFKTKEEHNTHHIQTHGGQTNAEMTCIRCGYMTRDPADMEVHKNIHAGAV